MSLSRPEQETIINFNEAEAAASVYTHNGRIRRIPEQLGRDRPDEVSRDHNGDFIIPKGWIKINPTRILSEEQLEKKREAMKHARHAQNP